LRGANKPKLQNRTASQSVITSRNGVGTELVCWVSETRRVFSVSAAVERASD
jgi:hypothetical protein